MILESCLIFYREQDIKLNLINRLGFQENLGTLNIRLTVIPKNEDQDGMEHVRSAFRVYHYSLRWLAWLI